MQGMIAARNTLGTNPMIHRRPCVEPSENPMRAKSQPTRVLPKEEPIRVFKPHNQCRGLLGTALHGSDRLQSRRLRRLWEKSRE